MAFIEESDVSHAAPAPRVIIQQAKHGPLVPVLLLVLIVAVLGLAAVIAWPHLKPEGSQDSPEQMQSVADIDPQMLVTPTGRKLDVVEFGGFVFEITRLAYSDQPRARTVTITVPGNPPQMGVFHVGESFAGGKLRVVEITASSVVLDASGTQKVFAIQGADPSEIWDRSPAGTHLIPPIDKGAIPDLPAGAVRPPRDPREEIADEPPTEEGESREPKYETLEDFPDVREKPMARADYQKMIRNLPDDFAADFVLAIAIERDTRLVYGLEIKNLHADSYFYAHGLKAGDVITAINGQRITSIRELDAVLKSNSFREEFAIDVERAEGLVTFVFFPGLPD